MSGADIFALLPLLIVCAGSVLLLLLIALRRDHRLTALLTGTTLLLALASLVWVAPLLPRAATPLLFLDGYSQFFMLLILLCALLLLPFCYHYLEDQAERAEEFYLLLLLTTLGGQVLVTASHLASLVLGLELMSLALVVMVAYPYQDSYSRALEAAIKYLILSGAASATLLFGAALIYMHSGSLALDSAMTGATGAATPLLLTGILLLLAGVAFKLSLVPFHLWTPDVYQGAPLCTTAVLATLAKAAVAAVLLRLLLLSGWTRYEVLFPALAAIAVASMLAGNLLALLQENLKRLLAFSAIAHFGYLLVILLALQAGSPAPAATESWAFYLCAYLASTLAAFAVLLRLSVQQERVQLDQLRGLFWRRPALAAVMAAAMISLAGIPMSVGFIGKFYIVTLAVEETLWLLLLVVVMASAIGLFFYLRVVLIMSRSPVSAAPGYPRTAAINWLSRLAIGSLGLLIVGLGLYPAPLIELLQML